MPIFTSARQAGTGQSSTAKATEKHGASPATISRRALLQGALGIAAVPLLAPFARAQGRIKVRIAWQPGVQLLLFIARQEKLFEHAGLDVQYFRFNAGPPMFAALRTGGVDIAPMGAPPAAIILSQEPHLRAFLIGSDESHAERLVVQPDAGIRNVSGLKGKKIGLWRGTSSEFALQKALEKTGLSTTDVKVLDLDVTALIPAFKKKEIDAVWVWDPWALILQKAGAKTLVTDADVGVKMPDPWLARSEFLQNPEGARRIIAAVDKASAILKSDRSLADTIMAEQLMLSKDMAHEIIDHMVFPTPEQQYDLSYGLSLNPQSVKAGTGLVGSLNQVATFLAEKGKIDKSPPDMKNRVDPEPLHRFMESRKAQGAG